MDGTADIRDGGTRRSLVVLGVLAAFSATALLLPARAPAAEPGVVPDLTWATSASDQDRTAAALTDVGAKWVRMSVDWAYAEQSKGSYNPWWFAQYDGAIQRARNAGSKIILMVYTSPSWASGSTDKDTPPTNPADYANFMRYLATRYEGQVDAYEVWNEENFDRFWGGIPDGDAVAYAALLRAAYPAIKGADPNATVVFGGLSTNDYNFVERAYNAGAKGYFDVMVTHPYSCDRSPENIRYVNGRIDTDSFVGYREVRASMLARGDDKPIWFTEFGWSTTTANCGVSEATQANYLTKSYQILEHDPYVQVAVWYNFRNNYTANDANEWEPRLGLMRTDFTPKPAYYALKSYVPGSGGGIVDPPANASPTVRLTAPLADSNFYRRLDMSAEASDDKGVAKVEFWVDSQLVRADTGAPYAHSWRVPRRLSYGSHTVKAIAFDAEGLSATDTVTVLRSSSSTRTTLSVTKTPRPTIADSTVLAGHVGGGADSGVVALKLQRCARARSRGHSGRRLVARLRSSGAFKRKVRIGRGCWRARAAYRGTDGFRPSMSRRLRFKV